MHCCNINKGRRGDFFWFTWYTRYCFLIEEHWLLPNEMTMSHNIPADFHSLALSLSYQLHVLYV